MLVDTPLIELTIIGVRTPTHHKTLSIRPLKYTARTPAVQGVYLQHHHKTDAFHPGWFCNRYGFHFISNPRILRAGPKTNASSHGDVSSRTLGAIFLDNYGGFQRLLSLQRLPFSGPCPQPLHRANYSALHAPYPWPFDPC